jgi:DNA-binding transcriptional ArsR family regulator
MSVTALPVLRARGTCCELPIEVDEAWAGRRAELLKALADRTRLSMLASLVSAEAPVCVCDFTAAFKLSQPTVSHHMGKLREAGLVDSEKRGIWVHYSLRSDLPAAVRRVVDAVLA